ncbi:Fic family protein [Cupriavidus lacunae]|uniref:Fic family protein n=2 Tax=Cupriavidus lacunae TaxID=2666307 RepID=A0A370NJV0_9BURK|nr:Fic family protein [Cupriavidus lacunae]
MQSDTIELYDNPRHFEPLLPQKRVEELVSATRVVIERAHRLQGTLSHSARTRLRELVRSMNSYYSNRIEGESTHPVNIDRALQKDFSAQPETAKLQRLAVAHIEAERELEGLVVDEASALKADFLLLAHKALYGRLTPEDRSTHEGEVIDPGQLRIVDVAIQQHHAPTHSSLPRFMERMTQVYGRLIGLDALLYSIAAAHHRAVWTHPFRDGNGRAARLQTHCALFPLSGGLWSVNRGLARKRDDYYALLKNADMPRHGDLDGRGNLSERMLWEWCRFFIEQCDDQVSFMTSLLDINGLRERIQALVVFRSQLAAYPEYRQEAVLPLHHLVVAGPVPRGDFVQMTGLGERTGRKLLSQLLKDGLLISEDHSHRGAVGIGFPLDSLTFLFPNLYPEAATSVETF